MDNKSGASVQENYRKTTEVVRPCDENERGAHSEKNAGCGNTRENKKREAKPKWLITRGVTIRYPHDTIRIAILESRYDTYRDTW